MTCPFTECTLNSIFGTCRYSLYCKCEDYLKWQIEEQKELGEINESSRIVNDGQTSI